MTWEQAMRYAFMLSFATGHRMRVRGKPKIRTGAAWTVQYVYQVVPAVPLQRLVRR